MTVLKRIEKDQNMSFQHLRLTDEILNQNRCSEKKIHKCSKNQIGQMGLMQMTEMGQSKSWQQNWSLTVLIQNRCSELLMKNRRYSRNLTERIGMDRSRSCLHCLKSMVQSMKQLKE